MPLTESDMEFLKELPARQLRRFELKYLKNARLTKRQLGAESASGTVKKDVRN